MYTYQVFEANDHSNARVEAARQSFGKTDAGCYVILSNDQMQYIQFADNLPYPGETMAQAAQNHIDAMAAQAAAGI